MAVKNVKYCDIPNAIRRLQKMGYSLSEITKEKMTNGLYIIYVKKGN